MACLSICSVAMGITANFLNIKDNLKEGQLLQVFRLWAKLHECVSRLSHKALTGTICKQ